MATVNGVNYAKTNAPSDGNWKMNPVSEVGGTLRVLYDTYEASALAAASTINVGRIPQDSRVWNVIMVTDDLSTTATLSVGRLQRCRPFHHGLHLRRRQQSPLHAPHGNCNR